MSDFRELKSPELGGYGWFVATKSGDTAWLTIHGDITRDVSTPAAIDLVYHKTEGDAYRVMASYYNKHGRVYAGIMVTATQAEYNNESQVMVFK